MAANIVFVDEATIDEVFGGEDSDGDQSTSDAVSEEGESDVSEQESDIGKKMKKKTGLLVSANQQHSTSQLIKV